MKITILITAQIITTGVLIFQNISLKKVYDEKIQMQEAALAYKQLAKDAIRMVKTHIRHLEAETNNNNTI